MGQENDLLLTIWPACRPMYSNERARGCGETRETERTNIRQNLSSPSIPTEIDLKLIELKVYAFNLP